MGKNLSQELREFAFKEIDDPINELDRLAEQAKILEGKAHIYDILRAELGAARVEMILTSHTLKEVAKLTENTD